MVSKQGLSLSAIYGIIGDGDVAEVRALGARLGHRGAVPEAWPPGAGAHFGVRYDGARGDCVEGPLIFDGFLDNAAELAAEVGLREVSGPLGDAAVALAVYRRFGLEGFGRLSGQFVLAIWEESRRRLVIARDRWGARSLYYARVRGRLHFASEYKALLASDDLPARCNREAIVYAVRTRHGRPDVCFLEDVAVVPRGSWLTVQDGELASGRFWDIVIDVPARPEAEHAAELRARLLDSIRRQIAPHQAVGVALSGGLDSAVVVAGIRHVAPEKPVHTFTAGYGPDDGEIVRAREVAQHFATVHHEIVLAAEAIPAALPGAVWHMEDAVGGEEMVYQYVAAREAARHIDNVFTGHKADVLFGGMPRHKLLKLAIVLRPIRGTLEEFFHFTQVGQEPDGMLASLLVRAYYRDGRPPHLSVLGGPEPPPARALPFDGAWPLSQKLRRDIMEGSSKLGATMQLHAAFGLRWKSPFMDSSVVRTAFRIPDDLKIRGLRQKHILRRACHGMVPPSILDRRKSLQRLKHDLRLSGVLEALAAELLAPPAVAARGLFAPAEVERLRRRPIGAAYPKVQTYALWSLLLTEIWARTFLDRRGAGPLVLPNEAQVTAS